MAKEVIEAKEVMEVRELISLTNERELINLNKGGA